MHVVRIGYFFAEKLSNESFHKQTANTDYSKQLCHQKQQSRKARVQSPLGNSVATISRSEVPIRDGEEETFDFLKWMKGGR